MIENMVVLSGTAIGNEPEDAIIDTMNRLADVYGLDVIRRFVFEGTEISITHILGCRYATLRITDPMVDPFERIGTGWRFLVSWLEDHDFKEPDFNHCSTFF